LTFVDAPETLRTLCFGSSTTPNTQFGSERPRTSDAERTFDASVPAKLYTRKFGSGVEGCWTTKYVPASPGILNPTEIFSFFSFSVKMLLFNYSVQNL
jgi:hypothetical protein